MFWGLIMEPQKRYSQTVKNSFHVSMAAIDIFSSTDEPVQVMCSFENRKYLLCTLHKTNMKQCALDLNFEVGDKVTFLTNGESHVHLTGYLNDPMFGDEEEAEEEEEADLGNISPSNIVSGKRQKKMISGELPPAKKSKTLKLLAEVNSQDEDDSDDSDVNLSDIMMQDEDDDETTFVEEEEEDEEGDDGSDDEDGEEEEDGDEVVEEEDGSDEEESSLTSDEEEADEEEEEVEVKPKMNGTAKKGKKDKKQKQAETASPKGKSEKTPKGDKSAKTTPAKSPKQEGSPQKKTVEGGVIVEDIRVGNGQPAKPGKMVQVYYEGRFKNNNKMFDSSTKGNGFKFRLGKHEVIKGWDVGISGMKVGGKRRIVCPPHMAYGAKGSPPAIPPNSTLVFEVELKNVN